MKWFEKNEDGELVDSSMQSVVSKYPFVMKIFQLLEDNSLKLVGYCGANEDPKNAKAEHLNALNRRG